MASQIADWYSPKVEARTLMGKALLGKGLDWLMSKRLLESDAQELVTQGEAAKQADIDQKVQLAEQAVTRTGRKVLAEDVTRGEGDLADVLPAIIGDLVRAGQHDEALFLAKLSFARYRIVVVSVPVDPNAEPTEEMKKVERVQRSDLPTRARGLAALCSVILQRPPIVAALAARGFEEATLEKLGEDAEAIVVQGSNQMRRVEATEREAAAVLAQRTKWSEIRRLVKSAVQGDAELEEIFSRC